MPREETPGGPRKQHPSSLRGRGDIVGSAQKSSSAGRGGSSRGGTSAGRGGHDRAGGTSGDGGGHAAGGSTGAAVVVEVDAVRLASAVGSYRCLLVGDCLSIEQQPPKDKYLVRTYQNISTTIRS